jgi:hypothetical protein
VSQSGGGRDNDENRGQPHAPENVGAISFAPGATLSSADAARGRQRSPVRPVAECMAARPAVERRRGSANSEKRPAAYCQLCRKNSHGSNGSAQSGRAQDLSIWLIRTRRSARIEKRLCLLVIVESGYDDAPDLETHGFGDQMAHNSAAGCLLFTFLCGLLSAGADAQPASRGSPAVGVARAERQQITQTDEFIGRIQAVGRVALVARISAFLEQQLFVEGAEVKNGDLLYRLEQPPFQAQVQFNQATVEQLQAQHHNAELTLWRALCARPSFLPLRCRSV